MASRFTSDPARAGELPFPIGQLPPRKVAWLHPIQLFRTGYHSLISSVATGFLDRREMLAAINRGDRPGDESSPDEALVRDPEASTPPGCTLRASDALWSTGEVWIDFVADLGDSWDATYATAMLLAKQQLKVRGHTGELPQANVLVLGGDLVYPTPTRWAYRTRLRSAFIAAMPRAAMPCKPCLLAIPGNHDWYDGLTSFVREFCQGGWFGGWTLVQSRSYFAAKVAPGWWIWGIDIALDTRIDAPQQNYFLEIMKVGARSDHRAAFKPGDNVILCTAKPVWLDDPRHSDEAYKNLAYFVRDVMEPHGARAPVILAGDVHHYSRYENGNRQLIVSGGGGAYLSGTHHLPAEVPALQRDGVPTGTQAKAASETSPVRGEDEESYRAGQFPYPSHADSRHMAMRALLLAFRPANWPFDLTVGAIYWLLAWEYRGRVGGLFKWPLDEFLKGVWTLLTEPFMVRPYVVALLIVAGCIAFALGVNKGSRLLRGTWGFVHGAMHIIAALGVAWLVAPKNALDGWVRWLMARPTWPMWPAWLPELVLGVLFVLMAAVIGATIVGIYLVLSDRLFRWHRNEVFAVQSIVDYRNFLRMKIEKDGSLVIFPIGLNRVPRQWRARVTIGPRNAQPSAEEARSCYEPGDYELTPHLIEAPIRIRRERPAPSSKTG